MTTISSARAQTLAAMETAHDTLMAALGGLPDAALERHFEGAWSLKDMLAHLAAWDEIGASDCARLARGHAPILGSFKAEDVDEWNAYAVRRRRHFSPAQTIAELEYGGVCSRPQRRPCPMRPSPRARWRACSATSTPVTRPHTRSRSVLGGTNTGSDRPHPWRAARGPMPSADCHTARRHVSATPWPGRTHGCRSVPVGPICWHERGLSDCGPCYRGAVPVQHRCGMRGDDMETLVELSWRGYPAAALLLLGALVGVRGLRQWWNGARRPVCDPEKNLTWMLGFRLVFVGLALAGTGAAWAWQLPWLLALTLAVCGEETLESSICIAALRQARRYEVAQAARAPRLPHPA